MANSLNKLGETPDEQYDRLCLNDKAIKALLKVRCVSKTEYEVKDGQVFVFKKLLGIFLENLNKVKKPGVIESLFGMGVGLGFILS